MKSGTAILTLLTSPNKGEAGRQKWRYFTRAETQTLWQEAPAKLGLKYWRPQVCGIGLRLGRHTGELVCPDCGRADCDRNDCRKTEKKKGHSPLYQISSHQSDSKPQGPSPSAPSLSWAPAGTSSGWGTPRAVSPGRVSRPLQRAAAQRALPA